LSGVSYFTWQLARSLHIEWNVSVLLMRSLIPKVIYPGRDRIGSDLSSFSYDPAIPVFDGIDWWWIPSIFNAARFMRRRRPDVVLMQWWTGAVAHSYLALALVARLRGSKVVLEFHEVQDVGEARVPLARGYARLMMAGILRQCSGVVLHSEYDSEIVAARYRTDDMRQTIIPLGPFDQYRLTENATPRRPCSSDALNILFFGVIRPYKGLENLVRAFGMLSEDEAASAWLTVVGETWEGWTLPSELISNHPYRDRITFVNRYVTDHELSEWLAGADLVVLPYLRSSSSGPLHTAMSMGLPIVVSSVGGLPEAAGSYVGARFVEPGDVQGIKEAILEHTKSRVRPPYEEKYSWNDSRSRYLAFFAEVRAE
jgi:glycosyltransferase involved in cell wall biosynthesis